MRVLVVKISALGDVIHALPVLTYIKDVCPDAQIDWLVEEAFAPLLEGHPDLRQVHCLRLKRWRRQGLRAVFAGVREVLRQLRSENYDVVLDLQGNSKSGLFTLFCKAPLRYGFASNVVREWPNLLSTNRKVRLAGTEHHVSDQALAVARAAFPRGQKHPLTGTLSVAAQTRAAVEKQLAGLGLAGGPLVVLQYGTTWPTKFWPVDRWQQLVNRLAEEDGVRPLLIWGDDREYAVCRQLSQGSDGRAVIWPRGSLADMAALLQCADLMVGGDTGPVHIAAAVGTATVSIYFSSDGSRSGPRGEQHIRLQAPWECGPCFKRVCPRGEDCGSGLEVDTVLEAVRRSLAQYARPRPRGVQSMENQGL